MRRARRPDHIVELRTRIDLGGRIVTVEHLGRGHTDHDLIVVVPGEPAVVFCGDLVEESADPAIDEGSDLRAWPATLNRVLREGGRAESMCRATGPRSTRPSSAPSGTGWRRGPELPGGAELPAGAQHQVEHVDEVVRRLPGDAHRRFHLEDVLAVAGRLHDHSQFAHALADRRGVLGRRLQCGAVTHQFDPRYSPLPWIVPISGWRVASSLIRAMRWSPTTRALRCSPSRSSTSRTVSPTTQDTGLPPAEEKKYPWLR